MSRSVPARTRALGRLSVVGDEQVAPKGIQNIELEGVNSNQDHSLPYHGALSDEHVGTEGIKLRARYWKGLVNESFRINTVTGLQYTAGDVQ